MAINVISTKNAMALDYAAKGDVISLHTASPGQGGTDEVTGGSPAYARQTTVWNTAGVTDGLVIGSEVVFNVPAGTVISHVGLWHSGGAFIDWVDSADITFVSQGEVKVTPRYQQS